MPRTISTTSTSPRIELNRSGWDAACRRAGLATDAARAEFLGVTRQHVNAVQNGHRGAGEVLIIAALRRFDAVRFEDIFTISEREQ